ncbi:MAG: radical SAM family heme chaperone HemW [Acidimicrobiia bacterium]
MRDLIEEDRVTLPAAYIHIPFCSAVCPYCDFAVVAGRDDMVKRYVAAVVAEIHMSPDWAPLHSVYFGGGTPSHIDPSMLGEILEALADRHGIAADAELSLEANPEDFTIDQARQVRSLGFNRISFGAQSFDTEILTALGRRHLPGDIQLSVANARAAGFDNLSLDLIYGTPGETDLSWASTVAAALQIAPDHLSCYALTVERGTPLHRSVSGGAPAPDPDTQADRYEMADRAIEASGLTRYEVSNWARPGKSCRYNLTVWAQGEYEAYGNGAHRFRDSVRSHNVRRIDAYVDRVESGVRPTSGDEAVEGWDRELDRLFVGLRTTHGVATGPGTTALLAAPEGEMLLRENVIEIRDGRMIVTRPLLTDEVLRAVLGLPAPAGAWNVMEPNNV